MKYALTLILFCLVANTSKAQTTRWASKVKGFSTENTLETGRRYRASQVLSWPSCLQSQTSAAAWRPATETSTADEWISVGFDTLMFIRQVIIHENFGAGCVVKVLGYDDKNTEVFVLNNPSGFKAPLGKSLSLVLDKTTTKKIASIKIMLNTQLVAGWNEIDAIGISASDKPQQASIDVSAEIPVLVRENLGAAINSSSSEVAPIISPDGKTIFFTRYDHPQNLKPKEDFDIWFAKQIDGQWQEAKNIGSPVNNLQENSITYISPDERTALVMNIYEPNGDLRQGLSMSKRKGNVWSFPEMVDIKNYSNQIGISAFTMSPNGKTMVLSLQNENSFGDTDLYISYLQKDGSWSQPLNMGTDLNTPEAERTPFISADTKTIYFTSEGRAGYGASDIFLSRRLDDTWLRWSPPQNLGPSINSVGFDAHFTIPASGAFAYFCSEEKSFGGFDIFRLKLPLALMPEPAAILTGQVLDKKSNLPIEAQIVFESLEKIQKTDADKVDYDPTSGEFKVVLPISKVYGVSAIKKGYQALSDTIDLRKEKNYREIKRDLFMIPIEVGQKMILNNVFFEQGQANVLATSFSELDRIVLQLLENPNMEILLEGHTDNQGDFDANLKLSKERVEAVKKYFVTKGLTTNRISVKGWGSTRPIFNNQNEEKRKLNRRVEFTVLKK